MSLLGIQDPSIKMVVDKGRSIPIFTKNMVDTLGLGKRVLVTAASVGEREGDLRVLKQVKRMGQAVS